MARDAPEPRPVRATAATAPVGARAVASLLILFVVSVLNQADRWVFPALAPAGLRCHVPAPDSCNASTTTTALPNGTSGSYPTASSPAFERYQDGGGGGWVTAAELNASAGVCAHDGCVDFDSYDQGILTGPAFAAVYVLSGVPLARLADTSSRLLVLSIGLCLWSGTVLATGSVQTTWQLYLTRLGLGIGEATCSPVAYSLLAEVFQPKHRALAISIYSAGTYVGASIGNLCGFAIDVLCWRWTFRLLGLSGFALFPFMFAILYKRTPRHQQQTNTPGESPSINEPPSEFAASITRDRVEDGNQMTIKATLRELIRCYPYIIITLAASVRFIGGYALGAWCATFYREHYGETPRSYGMKLFIVFMAGGLPGSILGGLIADRTVRYGSHWKAYIIAITQAIAAPLAVAIFFMPTANLSYIMLTVSFLFSESWMGVAASIVQDVHKPAVRCQASAVYIAIGTLVGCAGPVLVSAIISSQDKCDKNYKLAMLYIVPTTYMASALLFFATGLVRHCQRQRTATSEGGAEDRTDAPRSTSQPTRIQRRAARTNTDRQRLLSDSDDSDD